MKVTAIIEKSEDGWNDGQLEEMPAVLTQGKTIKELKDNLFGALKLLLKENSEMTILLNY
jgi:predicted RNase H-like HicB family nuclease